MGLGSRELLFSFPVSRGESGVTLEVHGGAPARGELALALGQTYRTHPA